MTLYENVHSGINMKDMRVTTYCVSWRVFVCPVHLLEDLQRDIIWIEKCQELSPTLPYLIWDFTTCWALILSYNGLWPENRYLDTFQEGTPPHCAQNDLNVKVECVFCWMIKEIDERFAPIYLNCRIYKILDNERNLRAFYMRKMLSKMNIKLFFYLYHFCAKKTISVKWKKKKNMRVLYSYRVYK